MFGIFRFALALLVVIYHLSAHHPAGWYSVYAFYILSGFLMTLVCKRKYALNRVGGREFLINRALRIYPPYLAVALLSLVILNIPALTQLTKTIAHEPDMGLPEGPYEWFQNLFIFGWRMTSPKLVPQVWSVFRELFYCALIYFIFARYQKAALGWLGVSLAFIAYTLFRGYHFLDVYTSFKTASLAYAAGCCMCHFHGRLRSWVPSSLSLIGVLAVLPFAGEIIRPYFFQDNSIIPFYVNISFAAYLLLALSYLKGSPKWEGVDRYLGNLSYPIYLCHFNVGIVMAGVVGLEGGQSDRLLLISFIPVLILAWMINRYVEQTIGYGYDKRRQIASPPAARVAIGVAKV